MRMAILVLLCVSHVANASDRQLEKCIQIELEIIELQEERDTRNKRRINALKKLSAEWQCYRRHTEITRAVGFR